MQVDSITILATDMSGRSYGFGSVWQIKHFARIHEPPRIMM